MPILNILSSTVSIAFFLFGLFIALNIVSMIGFCLLATVFALIFILNKKKLRSISSKRNLSNSQRYDKAIYLLNALKEMKIYGKLDYFFKPFEESSINYSISIAESQVISQSQESLSNLSYLFCLHHFSYFRLVRPRNLQLI